MKNTMIASLSLIVLATALQSASAAPIGNSNRAREYMISAKNLHGWSAGIYGQGTIRNVQVNGRVYELTGTGGWLYLGLDVLPWATLYATGGITDYEIGKANTDQSAASYGGGINFNILDHIVADPTIFEDRVRINGSVGFTVNSGDWVVTRDSLNWEELSGSLTISIINDCSGDKFYVPESIGLFAGAIYSELLGSDIDADDDGLGWTAGLQIFSSQMLSLEIGAQGFEGGDSGWMAGAHLRF